MSWLVLDLTELPIYPGIIIPARIAHGGFSYGLRAVNSLGSFHAGVHPARPRARI